MLVKKEQRNIEISEDIWRKVGSLAAEIGITKKAFVRDALANWIIEIENSPNEIKNQEG
jgi:predicted transcriptional regulator